MEKGLGSLIAVKTRRRFQETTFVGTVGFGVALLAAAKASSRFRRVGTLHFRVPFLAAVEATSRFGGIRTIRFRMAILEETTAY